MPARLGIVLDISQVVHLRMLERRANADGDSGTLGSELTWRSAGRSSSFASNPDRPDDQYQF
jgi:hypothetical protein